MKKHADNTLIPEENKFGIEEKFDKVDDTEELVDELEDELDALTDKGIPS